jgi:hypothetical protein
MKGLTHKEEDSFLAPVKCEGLSSLDSDQLFLYGQHLK